MMVETAAARAQATDYRRRFEHNETTTLAYDICGQTIPALCDALDAREIQVKRLQMAIQFELNSLPTMREETGAAGLVAVAAQIERNREGLERIMASVDEIEAALATVGGEGAAT